MKVRDVVAIILGILLGVAMYATGIWMRWFQ